MYASIQSERFIDFYCRIKKDAVLTFSNFLVFELVDSSFPDDISKISNGKVVGVFRHIAIDTTGTGYLFDFKNKSLDAKIGPCLYIAD